MIWYYEKNGQQMGPLSEEEFQQLTRSGQIRVQTLVWRDGMADWLPYGEIHAAGTVASDETVVCSVTGRIIPKQDALLIADKWVSAEYKNQALQSIKEGLPLSGDLRYASFWIRFFARFIDGIILLIVNTALTMTLVAVAIGKNVEESDPEFMILQALMSLVGWVIGMGYETWMVGRFDATLGKMVFGLKVVRPKGEKLTYMRAFGRYWGVLLSGLTLYIGFIIAAFDDEKRALHDRMCDTRVVKAR
jgi:uncharacterized RDD family membrane protein YckC